MPCAPAVAAQMRPLPAFGQGYCLGTLESLAHHWLDEVAAHLECCHVSMPPAGHLQSNPSCVYSNLTRSRISRTCCDLAQAGLGVPECDNQVRDVMQVLMSCAHWPCCNPV